MKKGMIKGIVMYPNGEGKTFDMDYYCYTHMPMVANLLGDALKGAAVEKGLASGVSNRTVDDIWAEAERQYLAINE